jgi:flagellar basal-body rod protein FlgG
MKAQMTNLDIIANNLANSSTVAFKKSRADFQDLLYQNLKSAGEATGPDSMHPVGQQIGVGTKLASITKEHSQGSLTSTDRELDVAIKGKGFIPVTGIEGNSLYTRDGSFKLDDEGNLVNSNGLKVENIGAIPSDARSVSFSQDGQVTYLGADGTETAIGTLQLAMFLNPSGLNAKGENLYEESPASGTASLVNPGSTGAGTIEQRFLELSNVSIVEEMVAMITSQRGFEINGKMIRATDEALSTANQIAR